MVITNLAYEIALEVRQAQTYGIGVRNSSNDASNFQYGYGVHFGPDTVHPGSSPTNSFSFFADTNSGAGSTKYVYDAGDTWLDTFHLPGGNTIAEICYYQSSATDAKCNKYLNSFVLDISFIRPNPEAHTVLDGDTTKADAAPVFIVLRSALGDKCKTVKVYSTGQISVTPNNTPCP